MHRNTKLFHPYVLNDAVLTPINQAPKYAIIPKAFLLYPVKIKFLLSVRINFFFHSKRRTIEKSVPNMTRLYNMVIVILINDIF